MDEQQHIAVSQSLQQSGQNQGLSVQQNMQEHTGPQNLSRDLMLNQQQNNISGAVALQVGQQQAADPYQEEADVLNDHAKSDSFVMRTLKQGVRDLRQMRGSQVPPARILCQYDWLIWYCDEKYLRGKSPNSRYANRHQKVRSMVARAEQLRNEFAQKYPGLTDEQLIAAERTYNANDEASFERDNQTIREHRVALTAKTAAFLPPDDAAFEREQQGVLAAYDALIGDYQSIADGFCILESTKTQRMKAQRILRRLQKERDTVNAYTFANRASQQFRRWNTGFVTETTRTVTDQVIQQGNQEFVEKKGGHELSEMIREMIGAGTCYARLEKVQKENGPAGYITRRQETLAEALNRAHDTLRIDVIYSAEAIQKMETIQIVDMLCGITARSNDEIYVVANVESIHNRDYLVVNDVQILDKQGSFGNQTFRALNVQDQEHQKKRIRDRDGKLRVGAYDPKVADRIIALNGEVLRNYLTAKGASEKTVKGFLDRLHELQTTLRQDKTDDNGKRKKWENHKTSLRREEHPLGYRLEDDESYQNYIIREAKKAAKYTYMSPDYFEGTGNKEGDELTRINRNLDEELDTELRVKAFKTGLQAMAQSYLDNKFGLQELPQETRAILDNILRYAQDTERGQVKANIHREHTIKAIYEDRAGDAAYRQEKIRAESQVPRGNLSQADYDKLVLRRIKENLAEEYGSGYEIFSTLEINVLLKLKHALHNRITQLEAGQANAQGQAGQANAQGQAGQVNAQAQPGQANAVAAELSALKHFQRALFGKINGSLDIPAAEQPGILYGTDRWINGVDKWVNRRGAPLFVHPPCISDISQGDLGNCYFLAALAAAAESSLDFVEKHMKDNGDGTVTVLFHKPRGYAGNSFRNVYVRVDKTVPIRNGNNVSAYAPLWVQLYEKAFLVSGLKETNWFCNYTYEQIEGGNARDALQWLTGRQSRMVYLQSGDRSSTTYLKRRVSNSWFRRDENGIRHYTEGFQEARNDVLKKIKTAKQCGKAMVAFTWSEFLDPSGSENYGDRTMQHGVAPDHAYTVLGTEEIEGREYVIIRNPWGVGVVDTLKSNQTGNYLIREADPKNRTGTFLMDLDAFTEHTHALVAG